MVEKRRGDQKRKQQITFKVRLKKLHERGGKMMRGGRERVFRKEEAFEESILYWVKQRKRRESGEESTQR